jgi:lipopolysaccharide export system permease protein
MFEFLKSCLSFYLARIFLQNFFIFIAALAGIVFLFDVIELMRRATDSDRAGIDIVVQMALLRLPEITHTLCPFAILFCSLFTFWQLSKRQEFVILRAAGVSVWQFLIPVVVSTLLVGIVMVSLINPLGAALYNRYTGMERDYFGRDKTSVVAIFDEGLWLRQDSEDGFAIVHAAKIDASWRLNDMMVLFFNEQNKFEQRIDGPKAILRPGKWVVSEAVSNGGGKKANHQKEMIIPTTLTAREIEESFSSPKAMGFWNLPSFIDTLDETGFDSTRLRIHLQSLLAQPFLYMAMIVLAACVALRPQRMGNTMMFILVGVVIGFIVYIMSNFLQAMGASHQLPVFLAAWSPTLIALLFGGTVLLMLEDG